MTAEQNDQWGTVELMGHAQTAGRISRPSDWGGLLRVDVPTGENGDYRTEFYGLSAIYSIKLTSEEIARAYAMPQYKSIAYDAPIVTREQHQEAVSRAERENYRLRDQVRQLEQRLTAINALPAPDEDPDNEPVGF